MVCKEDYAWAAGIIEGEGCISKTNKHSCRIDAAMHKRDIDVMQRLQRVLPMGKLYGPYNNKMVFWIAYGREAVTAALLDLWPHLGKRRRAKAIEFLPRFKQFFKHQSRGGM